MPDWRIIEGDCIEAMRAMPTASVDAIVTDPPYGLEFMGKDWDRFAGRPVGATERSDHMNRSDSHGPWGRRDRPINPNDYGRRNERCLHCGKWRISSNRCRCAAPEWEYRTRDEAPPAMLAFQSWTREWALEAKRVLKPGGHLLAFGGTRTYHRLAGGVEDAGFEVRDCIAWMYGSGFPKSLDVAKAIDKAAGAERDRSERAAFGGTFSDDAGTTYGTVLDSEPITPEAAEWQGWGTALKPAHEPIVVARKPLTGTVAANVLAHGTGALNVDGCRVGYASEADKRGETRGVHANATAYDGLAEDGGAFGGLPAGRTITPAHSAGRWPANVVLDPEAAATLDEQTGELTSGSRAEGVRTGLGYHGANGDGGPAINGDSGGASRFFYVAKASSAERNAGLDGRNIHPTVKPIALMRWLVRLVTPPGGTVLDPFNGSGTTGCAAVLEGFDYTGIEREAEYAAIARARIAWWAAQPPDVDLDELLAADRERAKVADSGQMELI